MRLSKLSMVVLLTLIASTSLSHASRHKHEFRYLDSLALLVKAYDATSTRQFNRALALYTRVIRAANLSSNHLSNAHRGRGDVYFEKGLFKDAIKDYEHALALNPHNAAAFANRGNVRAHQGSFSVAMEDLNTAILLNPHDAVAFQTRGNIYFYLGEFEKASTDFQRSLDLEPADLFSVIWPYLAKMREGESGAALLNSFSQSKNLDEWPGPVISLYLDEISTAELIEIASGTSGQGRRQLISEAYFYGGEYQLLHQNIEEAIRMFERSIAHGTKTLVEHTAAKAELKRFERN